MSYYEQIKAEVVKVCPEIMELKFGCEILCKDFDMPKDIIRLYSGVKYNIQAGLYVPQVMDKNSGRLYPLDNNYEILGSPIELHHILRTIGEDYMVDGSGKLYYAPIDGELEYQDCTYNLSVPLVSQSEETLKGLSELLTGNNK